MPCRGMAVLSSSGCFDCEPRLFARLSAQHDRVRSHRSKFEAKNGQQAAFLREPVGIPRFTRDKIFETLCRSGGWRITSATQIGMADVVIVEEHLAGAFQCDLAGFHDVAVVRNLER